MNDHEISARRHVYKISYTRRSDVCEGCRTEVLPLLGQRTHV